MPVPPVVALEIGSTKVIALVGERRDDGHIMITGMGEGPSTGVRKGEIIDFDNAVVCARSALGMAEETAKVAIREVYLAVSGGHIRSQVHRGTVPVSGRGGEILREDVEQVMDVARAVNLPADRDVLHTICQQFTIDDEQRVIQPEGMEGSRLSLDMLVLHGVRTRLRNMINVAKNVPMDIADVTFSGLCSALSVLTPEQKKSGALVVDLGGGTTDYVAYAGNVVALAGAAAVGGDHVTNDIALGFNVPTSRAEKVKREWGSALPGDGEPDKTVKLPPEVGFAGRTIALQALNTVIHARADETLGIVSARLEEAGLGRQFGAGVVLTGGGARLRGMQELAERVFGLPCTIGKPRNVSGLATATEGAEYATASGLVQYGFRNTAAAGGGFWGKVMRRLIPY
ncbi:MAG: cell division protein FtsA [Lentisphaerae bacterium]|nr:cell division protein FtsA [Lentisphaerota bacterium]